MMETALTIFLLALPIVCLLGGSIYCAVCLWRAQRKSKRTGQINGYVLHRASEVDRVGYLSMDEDDDLVESAHRKSKQAEQINNNVLHPNSEVSCAEYLLIDEDDDSAKSVHRKNRRVAQINDHVLHSASKMSCTEYLAMYEDDDSTESIHKKNKRKEHINDHTQHRVSEVACTESFLMDEDGDRLLFVKEKRAKHRKVAQEASSAHIKARQAKKVNDIPLQQLNKINWTWLACECLLYVFSIIVAFLVPAISGEQVVERGISLRECIACFGLVILTIGFDWLISRVDSSEISGWRSIVYAILPKKFSTSIFCVLLLGINFAVLCISFFSKDITYWFSSPGNVLLFSCSAISFLLIGNAVLSYTRKILEHEK